MGREAFQTDGRAGQQGGGGAASRSKPGSVSLDVPTRASARGCGHLTREVRSQHREHRSGTNPPTSCFRQLREPAAVTGQPRAASVSRPS